MEEYTVTVKAESMTAQEAMRNGINVRTPFNSDGTSMGYLIKYPDGHKLWLKTETFVKHYVLTQSEWFNLISYDDIQKHIEVNKLLEKGYKRAMLSLMIPKKYL